MSGTKSYWEARCLYEPATGEGYERGFDDAQRTTFTTYATAIEWVGREAQRIKPDFVLRVYRIEETPLFEMDGAEPTRWRS